MFTTLRKKLDKKLNEPAYQHEGEDYYVGIYSAKEIVDEVEKEFYKENPIHKYALLYAQNIMKYGVDISEKLETATQNAAALNEAYLRGRQDELERFYRLHEECDNDNWIPCSERLPDIDRYSMKKYWVTIHVKDYNNNYFTKSMKWNGYSKQWEWSNGKKVSDDWEVIAWKEYIFPNPYVPKGERNE